MSGRMLRDLIAAAVALLLLAIAASLATTLQSYRRRRQRLRDSERALGRTLIAEIPAGEDLRLFTEDAKRFYFGEESIDKDLIAAARLRVNGAVVAEYRSTRHGGPAADGRLGSSAPSPPSSPAAGEDGILRDRWDVVIDAVNGRMIVDCGAIRERVSQELARSVFDAVRRDVEARDR